VCFVVRTGMVYCVLLYVEVWYSVCCTYRCGIVFCCTYRCGILCFVYVQVWYIVFCCTYKYGIVCVLRTETTVKGFYKISKCTNFLNVFI